MTAIGDGPMSVRSGKVRVARLTDLAALGELSRLCQTRRAPDRARSGLPVSGPPIGMFTLFRLPLGAFRPHDLLYVYEDDGRLAGLLRVERESQRDEWTIVELDADRPGRGRRHPLPPRPAPAARREQARRGPVPRGLRRRRTATSSCSCRPASRATARRSCSSGRPDQTLPDPMDRRGDAQPAHPAGGRRSTALALARLYATATPAPVQRLEAYRLAGLGAPGHDWRVPRSSLAPILRFADVEAFVQEAAGGGRTARSSTASSRSAWRRRTSRTTCKVMARPGADADRSSGSGWA